MVDAPLLPSGQSRRNNRWRNLRTLQSDAEMTHSAFTQQVMSTRSNKAEGVQAKRAATWPEAKQLQSRKHLSGAIRGRGTHWSSSTWAAGVLQPSLLHEPFRLQYTSWCDLNYKRSTDSEQNTCTRRAQKGLIERGRKLGMTSEHQSHLSQSSFYTRREDCTRALL